MAMHSWAQALALHQIETELGPLNSFPVIALNLLSRQILQSLAARLLTSAHQSGPLPAQLCEVASASWRPSTLDTLVFYYMQ